MSVLTIDESISHQQTAFHNSADNDEEDKNAIVELKS
jgi:hypothetical protein